ncbi:MAG TPA: hypothetical protein VFH95_14845 [Candidatus Kapabacteria bacterium]|nr:hypothetical protein [Candidatus Kapabacteria bacterium]
MEWLESFIGTFDKHRHLSKVTNRDYSKTTQMLEKILILPKQGKKRTATSLQTIKARVASEYLDATEPQRYIERAEALHRAGHLDDDVLRDVMEEVERLEYFNRLRRLRENIHQMSEAIFEQYPVTGVRTRAPII